MQEAALGLTCREAFTVFSQNETLILQDRVNNLKAEIERWKNMYYRQLQRVEWAGDKFVKHDIVCGCLYGDCEECGNETNECTCLIKTCQCYECDDDMRTWGLDNGFNNSGHWGRALYFDAGNNDENFVNLKDLNGDGNLILRLGYADEVFSPGTENFDFGSSPTDVASPNTT